MDLIQAKLFNGALIWNNELLSDYQEIRTQKPEQERVEEVAEEISSMQLTLFNYISIE